MSGQPAAVDNVFVEMDVSITPARFTQQYGTEGIVSFGNIGLRESLVIEAATNPIRDEEDEHMPGL